MKRKLFRIAIALITLIAIATFGMVVYNLTNSSKTNNMGNGAIYLVPPAFAQTAQISTFPAGEAGICAYVNAKKDINLQRLENMFKGIVKKKGGYIIGVVELKGLDPRVFPYVYVKSDGWIIAYYSVNTPSSAIMQWTSYDGSPITTTTLQDSIAKVCDVLGFDYGELRKDLGFYHFRYPEATKILLVAKGRESFTYTIPSDVKIYESSWAGGVPGSTGMATIDGNRVIDYSGGFSMGIFPKEYLTPEEQHTVSISYRTFVLTFVYGAK